MVSERRACRVVGQSRSTQRLAPPVPSGDELALNRGGGPAPGPDRPPSAGLSPPEGPDRDCLFAMLVRLVTGCSWVDAERLAGGIVSDITLRARRDQRAEAGVFDQLAEAMIATYDAEVGLEPAEAMVDGSIHKAPRGKLGWKWSIATDAAGIPIGWVVASANTNDTVLLPATLESVDDQGLLEEIETLHLDRGYDNGVVRGHVADFGIAELVVPRVRPRDMTKRRAPMRVPLGRRWPVERPTSWLSNYGQLRRNTDRKAAHRSAQLAFVIAILLIAKLLDQGCLPRA